MTVSLRHRVLFLLLSLSLTASLCRVSGAATGPLQTASAQAPAVGVPFTAEKLSALLPPSVYFLGKSAPLQIRNSGGTVFAGGAILWAALVDSSGYASNVQERFQFYLVTEGPLRVGDVSIPAGVYGGGFLGDHFLLMDIGGHPIAQGDLQADPGLVRPRPLQVMPDSAESVKLYLGRHWVLLHASPQSPAQ